MVPLSSEIGRIEGFLGEVFGARLDYDPWTKILRKVGPLPS